MQTTLVIIALVIAGYVTIVGSIGKPMTKDDTTIAISINNTSLNVWLADNLTRRTQGLSGTKSLPENGGMLFDFGGPTTPSFWMKDMHYPIDIIWIDKDMKIIAIEEGVNPSTFPKIFSPPSPVQYVLEVRAGFVKKQGIKVGEANALLHLYQEKI